MSSSITAQSTSSTIASNSSSLLGNSTRQSTGVTAVQASNISAAQFREIHKNTWLKRLTADGKKITVGPKKSERSWVVFCVHDDTEALLEGYAEPRQAASHIPEWIVSMQDTLHISHALIPNSHEFEFVVTLSNEVVRFHAMSWEIMQEWVETLRSKLREMKILSPRENLYTKLPEIRAPLLPTRDPTSPLPATPPVPAAIVPGVERVVPQSTLQAALATTANETIDAVLPLRLTSTSNSSITTNAVTTTTAYISLTTTTAPTHTAANNVPILTAMSNTLTQNLLNMLSDPITAYSEHLNVEAAARQTNSSELSDDNDDDGGNNIDIEESLFATSDVQLSNSIECLANLIRSEQTLPSTSENSLRVGIGASSRTSADHIKNLQNLLQCERLIPRPQTSRSLSAGAADKSRKQIAKVVTQNREASATTTGSNNVTELEISADEFSNQMPSTATSAAPSPLTTTTTSSNAATDDTKTNITIIQVSTNSACNKIESEAADVPPKLPAKNVSADIFKFPETSKGATAAANKQINKQLQHEYKSNVQIIPSNSNNSAIQVLLGQPAPIAAATAVANQYSTPIKKPTTTTPSTATENHKITTVHVAGNATITSTTVAAATTSTVSVYGTCYTPTLTTMQTNGAAYTQSKKIILTANTSGVTNITVNNTATAEAVPHDTTSSIRRANCAGDSGAAADNSYAGVYHNAGTVHYEKVFLSSSIPVAAAATTSTANFSTSTTTATKNVAPLSPKPSPAAKWNSPRRQAGISSLTQITSQNVPLLAQSLAANSTENFIACGGSPVLQRRHIGSPSAVAMQASGAAMRRPFLTRGLTEVVITARPSRKDFHLLKSSRPANMKSTERVLSHSSATTSFNNNDENLGTSSSINPPTSLHAAINLEQRRRSSSTSDVQRNNRSTNNNELPSNRVAGTATAGAGAANASVRIQQPPQPFRNGENGVVGGVGSSGGGGVGIGNVSSPTAATAAPVAKRMTLREQQVMQLRREIMHPGGVRLQLRRKDCVGSIAWVDAFGAVWVAGWKQKEHPVLYNALHIGDQLLSIAGITISTAGEANKIIRNANTLFVEVLVRRIPFGRGYAIRREREGQCLGLIRDGNTATIVDVVPNSLAARHGLPPKAQACDGATLTFWVLTEINGRPLNLFFKEHEIRDRLNSVGRDISILVQPSDLIAKLKKQLKSLRGYKDYLVQ